MDKIVRAVDAGYRLCKYVAGLENANIVCKLFPAIAPMASGRDLAEALGRKRKTVVVEVNGLAYEVGPEAALAQQTFPPHNLDDNYVDSDEYLALMRGALHYMRVEHIDLLVVGLPVSTVTQKRAALAKRLIGEHPIGDGRTVAVKNVKVLAQPQGALMSYALSDGHYRAMKNQRNLIADCGGRTFDWLVTEGLKVIEKRSHAVNRGMYDVTLALAQQIEKALGARYHDDERLDRALQTRTNPTIFGKEYPLKPHMAAAKKVAHEAVIEMKRYVQEGSDIDNIIVAGGAAFFFRDAIKEAFPRHEIHELVEAVYANVRGFQLAGMEILAAEDKRAYRQADIQVEE